MGSLTVWRFDSEDGADQAVAPGTSALFVLTTGAVLDKVSEAFQSQAPHLVFTNLSNEQEKTLREAFAE